MVAVPQCSAERAQTSFTTFSAPPQEGGEGVGGQGEVFGLFVCLFKSVNRLNAVEYCHLENGFSLDDQTKTKGFSNRN